MFSRFPTRLAFEFHVRSADKMFVGFSDLIVFECSYFPRDDVGAQLKNELTTMRILFPKMFGCGESSIKLNTKFTILLALFFIVVFLFLVIPSKHHKLPKLTMIYEPTDFARPFNRTYPFTARFIDEEGNIHMRLALISDPDTKSKLEENTWVSKLQFAELILDSEWKTANLLLKEKCDIRNQYAYKGRGSEFSELIAFNGDLYTVDDRTGIIYRFIAKCPDPELIPWVILSDGPGNMNKGFKAEWLAVKDDVMFVGGMGKPFSDPMTGQVINNDPMYVKAISHTGQVQHLDWRQNYRNMLNSLSLAPSGYLLHEAAAWSQHHKQWFFLPRRESSEMYNEVVDEEKGTNVVIRTSSTFSNVKYSRLPAAPIKKRGFSSFKFVPHTNDLIIIGIKTKEFKGEVASYATVFKTNMDLLMEEIEISPTDKFEGVEFV